MTTMAENVQQRRRNKELSCADRRVLYWSLKAMMKNDSLPPKSYAIVARDLGVAPRAVGEAFRDITKKVLQYQQDENNHGNTLPDHLFGNNRKNCGREKFWDREAMAKKIKSMPYKDRMNYRSLSGAIGVPLSTVYNLKAKERILRKYRASLKPILSEQNQMTRLQYALDQINGEKTPTRHCRRVFKDCLDVVHVDEKWFFIIKEGQKYILVFDEEPPTLVTRNKHSLEKVMFLCALARPRMVGNRYWDGKIGIWPVGHVGQAQRKTKYHNRGDPIWVNETVNREKYTEMLLDHVLPAIVAKWPSQQWNDDNFVVRIQQDGAKAHIPPNNEQWFDLLTQVNLEDKIELYTQPANSPDTNINDLGFFASLQASYYRFNPRSAFDIISTVQKAYDEYCPKKLNRIWLSYQCCLNAIIEHHGGNGYILPHMNKAKLERENRLPFVIKTTAAAEKFIIEQSDSDESEYDEEGDKENMLSAVI